MPFLFSEKQSQNRPHFYHSKTKVRLFFLTF
nr:MAG TPA: hypothetical protein [Inoviridae sp.]